MAFTEFLISARERLSWIAETSYATGGTMSSGDVVGVNARIEPDWNQNWQEVISAGADGRSVESFVLGPLDLPYTLTFTMVDWKFLQYCGYSVVDAGGPTYTHTFSLANAVQSFKLEWALQHTTPVVFTLIGNVVLGATIAFQKATGEGGEGFVTVALRCIAKNVSIGSSVTSLSAITRSPYQWRHANVTINNNEVAEVNNGEITIDQGISPNDSRYCNSTLDRTIGEPIPKVQRLTGRVSVNNKDNTFMSHWNDATTISNCGISFIQDSDDNKLVSTFSNFVLKQGIPPTDLEGVSVSDLQFSATSFASLVATDTIATY